MATKKTYDEDEEVKEPVKEPVKEGEEAEAKTSGTINAETSEMSVTVKTKDDVSWVKEGMGIAGDGIAPNATVVRVDDGSIVMTASATKSAADVPLSIG